MALKFLNKKGWHTGTMQNIEKVWKAEQKQAEEVKKLEELKKQIEEERQVSELRQLQEQAGLIVRQDRLDFLYDSGLSTGKSSADEYLLGKPLEEAPSEDALLQSSGAPGALFAAQADKPPSANEMWRKLHSDPLLMIRQQEQAALAKIRSNPVRMAMLRKEAEVEKGKQRMEKKLMKAAAKVLRKEERRKLKELEKKGGKLRPKLQKDESTSEDSLTEDDARAQRPSGTSGVQRRGREPLPEEDRELARHRGRWQGDANADGARNFVRGLERSVHRQDRTRRDERDGVAESLSRDAGPPRGEDSRGHEAECSFRRPSEKGRGNTWPNKESREGRELNRTGDRPRSADDRRRRGRSPRSPSFASPRTRRRHDTPESEEGIQMTGGDIRKLRLLKEGRDREAERISGVHRSPSSVRRGKRERTDEKHSPRDGSRRDRKQAQHNSPSREQVEEERRVGEVQPAEGGGHSRGSETVEAVQEDEAGPPPGSMRQGHEDGDSAPVYGLSYARGAGPCQLASGGLQLGASRLAPAGGPGTVVEAPTPPPKVKHRAGQISAEDKARRLAEMQADAEAHEEARWRRLKREEAKDAVDASRDAPGNPGNTAKFLEKANRSIYGAEEGGSATVEESLRRRTHYSDKSNGNKNAFRR